MGGVYCIGIKGPPTYLLYVWEPFLDHKFFPIYNFLFFINYIKGQGQRNVRTQSKGRNRLLSKPQLFKLPMFEIFLNTVFFCDYRYEIKWVYCV